MRPFKPTRIRLAAFGILAVVVMGSNLCFRMYVPVEAELTHNLSYFVTDGEIEPKNACTSEFLNVLAWYRARLFAPLLVAAGDIDLLPLSTVNQLLVASTIVVLSVGYGFICLIAVVANYAVRSFIPPS